MLISFTLRFSCQNHLHRQTRLFINVKRTVTSTGVAAELGLLTLPLTRMSTFPTLSGVGKGVNRRQAPPKTG